MAYTCNRWTNSSEYGHVPDQVFALYRRYRRGDDVVTIPQHGDAVGDFVYLFEPVAEVHDPDTPRPQLPDQAKETADVLLRKGRRGLIHDQHACIAQQRARYLNELLLRRAEMTRRFVQVKSHGPENGAPPVHPAHADPVHAPPSQEEGAHEQVLQNREVWEDGGRLQKHSHMFVSRV
jgi:hypothetical protein